MLGDEPNSARQFKGQLATAWDHSERTVRSSLDQVSLHACLVCLCGGKRLFSLLINAPSSLWAAPFPGQLALKFMSEKSQLSTRDLTSRRDVFISRYS